MIPRIAASLALLTLALVGARLGLAVDSSPKSRLEALSEEMFTTYFKNSPTSGTQAGFHEYDSQMEDFSRLSILNYIKTLKRSLKQWQALNVKGLTLEQKLDRDLITSQIQGEILEWEVVRNWEKNPDFYSGKITEAAYSIMSRRYSTPTIRLRSLIAREEKMISAFQYGKENLKNPPKIFTEVALEQLPGMIEFFERDVPAAFSDVTDGALLSHFKTVNHKVIIALRQYEEFLKKKILPSSRGDFRIGANTYTKKLLYNESVGTNLEELLKVGYENLRFNQEWFKKVAAELDPQKKPLQILSDLEKDHPAPESLLENIKGVTHQLKDFLKERKIVTIPSEEFPIIQETPPFMRALTFASMDIPGPFENEAKEAFYNVTLPEKSWTKGKIEEYMAGFNRGTIISTSIHEAYPGHYIQFLWAKQAPTKARKLFGCDSNSEGWAHYVEQMILDEGFGGGDPKLRLGQLQDALLRNARFIVGIKMHTGQMSYEEAIDFFVNEGYQSRSNGEREAKRGTSDPTYLVYTLGKLQILKLREDYKVKMGKEYSLARFHDEFLKQGFPPIPMVRKALLHNADDGPVL